MALAITFWDNGGSHCSVQRGCPHAQAPAHEGPRDKQEVVYYIQLTRRYKWKQPGFPFQNSTTVVHQIFWSKFDTARNLIIYCCISIISFAMGNIWSLRTVNGSIEWNTQQFASFASLCVGANVHNHARHPKHVPWCLTTFSQSSKILT